MAKLTSILQQRFRKKEKAKMSELAEKTQQGTLTPFSGMFQVNDLSAKERDELMGILERFEEERSDTTEDLQQLIMITSEVKAINNQAAILHGERIKRAQTLLKRYKEGAFTAWLLATYGNRQTPYNFLQYFEFHSKVPKSLHPMIEAMPRQAIYTLASRDGSLERKEEIVRNYNGETKQELITKIRTEFPLDAKDRRRENIGEAGLKLVMKSLECFERGKKELNATQKVKLEKLIHKLEKYVR